MISLKAIAHKYIGVVSLVFAILALTACGGSGSSTPAPPKPVDVLMAAGSSCMLQTSDSKSFSCSEYPGSDGTDRTCSAGYIYSSSPCPTAGVTGLCALGGTYASNWFYYEAYVPSDGSVDGPKLFCAKVGHSWTDLRELKNVTVTAVNAGTVNDPIVVISTKGGSKISYFAPSSGAIPTQAQLTTASGVSVTSFYAADGRLDKVVDNSNGNSLQFHLRSDGLGMEYLLFDANGAFVDGSALFLNNGAWNTAQILGLPAAIAGKRFGSAAYGPMTPVNINLAELITPAGQVVAMNSSILQVALDILIPSAHAVTLSTTDLNNLTATAGLMIVGGVTMTRAPAFGGIIFAAASMEGLISATGVIRKLQDTIDPAKTGILENEIANQLDVTSDPVVAAQNTANLVQQGGISSLLAKATNVGNKVSNAIGNLINTPKIATDATPTPASLPLYTGQFSMPATVVNAPVVTSVTPSTAITGKWFDIIVRGTDLASWNSIFVTVNGGCWNTRPSGKLLGSGWSVNPNYVTFPCLPNIPGTYSGTVTDGSSNALLFPFSITVSDPVVPTITSTDISSGAVGTTVTIYGTGFETTLADNTVSFNGIAATVTAATAATITVTVPSGAKTGPISVTTRSGKATSSMNFTVTVAPVSLAPTISGFTPTSGAVGTTVNISGSRFSTPASSNAVEFNGVPATVTAGTTTSLTVTVPSGATTGLITVWNAKGTVDSAGSFTVGTGLPATFVTHCSQTGNYCLTRLFDVSPDPNCGAPFAKVASCSVTNVVGICDGALGVSMTYYSPTYNSATAASHCSASQGVFR